MYAQHRDYLIALRKKSDRSAAWSLAATAEDDALAQILASVSPELREKYRAAQDTQQRKLAELEAARSAAKDAEKELRDAIETELTETGGFVCDLPHVTIKKSNVYHLSQDPTRAGESVKALFAAGLQEMIELKTRGWSDVLSKVAAQYGIEHKLVPMVTLANEKRWLEDVE